ncbi:Sodium/hydrogen exchanger [Bimuria novae-zelandiae CBS 107.79]|uniref:Sodium/hydrogen exchanger n=1 Tax=Bimuria novae-zelandiae CBS 107.79 TaxID=1447943 RepID=A0A6A5V2U4_9PLEO|nr:Sodium/hydrogen exchanger [Bimuria novae-zelandiae CBS 107.79]
MDVNNAETAPSLPYQEPAIVTILVQSSFLLLLNAVNAVLDRLVYCGLLGQVLIGITWGTPGAKWLSSEVEEVIVQLGYLGLILLVYEGGLSTSFRSLKANLALSFAVAFTGIGVPIALSYTLQPLLGATAIQAFAAGAALCSTSLGTTFTVLASSGLSSTRLGVVLTSAAMMDDVVGLVMVQVISNLGGGDINAVTIVRPVLVSVAFAFIVPLICRFVVKPLTVLLNRYRKTRPKVWISKLLCLRQSPLVIHTGLLLGLVTGARYASTSNLFAAYIAGAVISWWDSEVPHPVKPLEEQMDTKKEKDSLREHNADQHAAPREAGTTPAEDVIEPTTEQNSAEECDAHGTSKKESVIEEETSGAAIYERYYQQTASRILQPLFFASIGFSIPITHMFQGSIVWRGIVYTILMTFGKLVCGLWLVRVSRAPTRDALAKLLVNFRLPFMPHLWGKKESSTGQLRAQREIPSTAGSNESPQTSPAAKPFSLHPPLILACAMTARGEIGFLISSVAESNGVFLSGTPAPGVESDIFLIVTWAIVLCTILGPIGVGLLVRRVKGLEKKKNGEQEGSGRDVLGVWGVE